MALAENIILQLFMLYDGREQRIDDTMDTAWLLTQIYYQIFASRTSQQKLGRCLQASKRKAFGFYGMAAYDHKQVCFFDNQSVPNVIRLLQRPIIRSQGGTISVATPENSSGA